MTNRIDDLPAAINSALEPYSNMMATPMLIRQMRQAATYVIRSFGFEDRFICDIALADVTGQVNVTLRDIEWEKGSPQRIEELHRIFEESRAEEKQRRASFTDEERFESLISGLEYAAYVCRKEGQTRGESSAEIAIRILKKHRSKIWK